MKRRSHSTRPATTAQLADLLPAPDLALSDAELASLTETSAPFA